MSLMIKFIIFLMMFFSFVLSVSFYFFFNEYATGDSRFLMALSGVVVAGSWSYLSIETSKEVRIRDEHVKFLDGFEESVQSFVSEAVNFYHKYSELKTFLKVRGVVRNSSGEKTSENCLNDHDLNQMITHYPSVKAVALKDELYFCHNLMLHKNNTVIIKGDLVDDVFAKEDEKISISKINDYCEEVLSKCNEMKKFGVDEIESTDFILSEDVLTNIQIELRKVIYGKTRRFEKQSESYQLKKWASIAFVFFGFLISFWNYTELL